MTPLQIGDPKCPRCLDTNCEIAYDFAGNKLGVVFRDRSTIALCNHRPLRPGEWLYEEQQRYARMLNEKEPGV